MKMTIKPELQVKMELEAHEKECAIRYRTVDDKLNALDKRMWRLEAMSMTGTFAVIALVLAVIFK